MILDKKFVPAQRRNEPGKQATRLGEEEEEAGGV